jgi:hypothetical protein
MTIKTITQAIEKSIKRDEIAHVHLLVGLRHEMEQARDFGGVESIDNLEGEHLASATVLASIVGQLIETAQNNVDAKEYDDVENGETWEMWGRTDHFADSWENYRVHIRLDR